MASEFLSPKDFNRQMKENQLGNLYLFFGEEAFLRRHYVSALAEKLVPPGREEFNLHRFDGKTLDAEGFLDALESYPVMNDKKLLIVRDLLSANIKGESKKKVFSSLSEIPEDSVVVFTYENPEHSFPSGAEEKELCALVRKYGFAVDCKSPGDAELASWVVRHFKARGKTIAPGTVKFFLSYCENSMDRLLSEIEKLSLYAKSEEISPSDVEAICVKSTDAKVYRLSDAYFKKDAGKLASELADLLNQREDPLYLLSGFGRAIKSALLVKTYAKKEKNTAKLAKDTGLREFQVKNYLRDLQSVREETLNRVLQKCVETDVALKSSKIPASLVIRNFFAGIFYL